MPFIQSVYCCSVRTSASGSACAENVASGLQYCRQPSQPFPASHAAKKSLATAVIVDAIAHLSVVVRAAPFQGRRASVANSAAMRLGIQAREARRSAWRDVMSSGEGRQAIIPDSRQGTPPLRVDHLW